MNKRIKELAEQAGYTEAYYESDDGPFVPSEFDKEKFAELIIRECADVAWQHTPDTEELEYSHLIEGQILKHFGVKDE